MTQAKRALLPLLGVAIVAGGFAAYALALADDDNGRAAPAAAPQEATSFSATAITLDAAVTPTLPPGVLHDAPAYARDVRVTVEEAGERIDMQLRSVEVNRALVAAAPERFATSWVEHQPNFRLVLRYKGGSAGLDRVYELAAESPIPVRILTGATHSDEELAAILKQASAQIRPESHTGAFVDSKLGAITINVHSQSPEAADPAALAARLEAEFGVPFIIEVSDARPVIQPGPGSSFTPDD